MLRRGRRRGGGVGSDGRRRRGEHAGRRQRRGGRDRVAARCSPSLAMRGSMLAPHSTPPVRKPRSACAWRNATGTRSPGPTPTPTTPPRSSAPMIPSWPSRPARWPRPRRRSGRWPPSNAGRRRGGRCCGRRTDAARRRLPNSWTRSSRSYSAPIATPAANWRASRRPWRAEAAVIASRPLVLVEPERWLPQDRLAQLASSLPPGSDAVMVSRENANGPAVEAGPSEIAEAL